MPLGLPKPGVRLRGARGAGGGPTSPSLFEQVLELSQGRPVFTADRYVPQAIEGGVSVRSFTDWNNSGHQLRQTSLGLQVPEPHASPVFGGGVAAEFTGAQWYRSTQPASAWVFLSDGVSVETWTVLARRSLVGLQTPWATVVAGGFGGALISLQASTSWYYWARASDGGQIVFNAYATPNLAIDEPAAIGARAAQSAAPNWTLSTSGRPDASGNYAAIPDAGAPEQTLVLGCQDPATLGSPTHMLWGAFACFPALAPEQRAIVRAWIAQDFSVPAT